MEAAAAAGSAQLAAAQNRKGSSDALYEKRVEVDIFGDVVDKTITRATIESWRDKFKNAFSKRPKVEEEVAAEVAAEAGDGAGAANYTYDVASGVVSVAVTDESDVEIRDVAMALSMGALLPEFTLFCIREEKCH